MPNVYDQQLDDTLRAYHSGFNPAHLAKLSKLQDQLVALPFADMDPDLKARLVEAGKSIDVGLLLLFKGCIALAEVMQERGVIDHDGGCDGTCHDQ